MDNNTKQAENIMKIAQLLSVVAIYLETVNTANDDTKKHFLTVGLADLANVIINTSGELADISDDLIELDSEE